MMGLSDILRMSLSNNEPRTITSTSVFTVFVITFMQSGLLGAPFLLAALVYIYGKWYTQLVCLD